MQLAAGGRLATRGLRIVMHRRYNTIEHVTRNDDRRDNIRWRHARVVYVTGGRMESSSDIWFVIVREIAHMARDTGGGHVTLGEGT